MRENEREREKAIASESLQWFFSLKRSRSDRSVFELKGERASTLVWHSAFGFGSLVSVLSVIFGFFCWLFWLLLCK